MPLALLAMFGWIALTIVDNQKDLVKMRIQLTSMDNTMSSFMANDKAKTVTSALIHHSEVASPCNSCHMQNGVVIHSLPLNRSKIVNKLSNEQLFRIKCGSCHATEKALARKADRVTWANVAREMQLKDAKWISAKEAASILDFLARKDK